MINPRIGIAKSAGPPPVNGDGTFDVVFTFMLENLGGMDLSNVQATDDLSATFPPPATFIVAAAPAATGTLSANSAFDGSSNAGLLNPGTSTLAAGASETISFTARFNPGGLPGPFYNTATASGEYSPGMAVADYSDNGDDPDPDGDGEANGAYEDDPTPILMSQAIPTLGEYGAALLFLLLFAVAMSKILPRK